MKTSVTISLLPSSSKMPFVLGPDLDSSIELAAQIGFDAVELFPPSLDAIDQASLKSSLKKHAMTLSTIGTGGGAVSQGLTLTDSDPAIRQRGCDYIKSIIDIAAEFGASAIIGSMQGKAGSRDRAEVLNLLGETLGQLDQHAKQAGQPLFYEPLNRYESDLTCTIKDAVDLMNLHGCKNVEILADLFHMNIEEINVAETIATYASNIGHVHFVDSNRMTAGSGHTDFDAIVKVLNQSKFQGYLAIEAFPLPDQQSAATNAMEAFKRLL